MADEIKFTKGLKVDLPNLLLAEPGFVTDEERLYIGGQTGNIPLPNQDDLDEINASLSEKANKNWIINGNFDFWQRGPSATNLANNSFLADRFKLFNSLISPPTSIIMSRGSVANEELKNSEFYYRVAVNGAGSVGTNEIFFLQQTIENGIKKLCGSGEKVTLSFLARSNITNKKIGAYLVQHYGGGGTPSVPDTLKGANFILTNTWTKFVITFETATLVGKTFGTNNDSSLRVNLVSAYGTDYAPVLNDTVAETFGGAGYIDIAQVKLESGDKATPFVPRPIAEELALCQRYYESSNPDSMHVATFMGGSSCQASYKFFVPKRSAPSVSYLHGSDNGKLFAFAPSGGLVTVNNAYIMLEEVHFTTSNSMGCTVVGQSASLYGKITADAEIY